VCVCVCACANVMDKRVLACSGRPVRRRRQYFVFIIIIIFVVVVAGILRIIFVLCVAYIQCIF